ncbi:hypothetical protein [Gloeocapsopsis dulcis]|uniref:hypothetical protein n=1 Tax=Gloeocapsopsis dulcis TaxID=2859516 RepID=UPI0012DA374E|nr:hypothetical protein [Gloeocapsopsis dulcis]WNN87780.1 hypothetical protein P0S91_15845 [Gloeocapsopsis dulcis]
MRKKLHLIRNEGQGAQILILERGRIVEYGDRQGLANNPNSRFAQLLQTGLTDVLV